MREFQADRQAIPDNNKISLLFNNCLHVQIGQLITVFGIGSIDESKINVVRKHIIHFQPDYMLLNVLWTLLSLTNSFKNEFRSAYLCVKN